MADASSFEHRPFRGSRYEVGGLMIWGFSHHMGKGEIDGPDFTQRTIEQRALTGKHWFFRRLASYFGADDYAGFWQGVAFANTLPTCVDSDHRFSPGNGNQRKAVKQRVERILIELAPSKVVLFSTKAWPLWPELNGSIPEPGQTLMTAPDLNYGTYDFGIAGEIRAYNLPHPQGQNTSLMTERVQRILAE